MCTRSLQQNYEAQLLCEVLQIQPTILALFYQFVDGVAKCQVDLPEFPDWELVSGLKAQSGAKAVGESAEEKGSALEESRKDLKANSDAVAGEKSLSPASITISEGSIAEMPSLAQLPFFPQLPSLGLGNPVRLLAEFT